MVSRQNFGVSDSRGALTGLLASLSDDCLNRASALLSLVAALERALRF